MFVSVNHPRLVTVQGNALVLKSNRKGYYFIYKVDGLPTKDGFKVARYATVKTMAKTQKGLDKALEEAINKAKELPSVDALLERQQVRYEMEIAYREAMKEDKLRERIKSLK